MSRTLPQLIIMLSGAALIVVGVVLVALQLHNEAQAVHMASQPFDPREQRILVDPGKGVDLTTRFVGLEIIIVGAALEIAGFLGLKPWRAKPDST
jgi:uncharacterized membrane protein